MRRPADHAVRQRLRTDFHTSFVVEAGAGTGKTTTLVDRIIAMLTAGVTTLDRLVAITFTEKAAGEMKLRLREEIEQALAASGLDAGQVQRLQQAAADLERAPISTIHSFCLALLKERPFEALLDPEFRVAAEVAGERSFDEAWQGWLEQAARSGEPALLRALALGLQPKQLRAAAATAVKDRDLFGAPIPEPCFDPAGLLGTVREVLTRVAPLMDRCTNHDDMAYQTLLSLQQFVQRAAKLTGPALELHSRRLWFALNRGAKGNWSPGEACTEVKQQLAALRGEIAAYRASGEAHLNWELRCLLLQVLAAYEAHKAAQGVVDYEDLLLRTRDLLAGSPPVRRYFQQRFDRIFVDECQDTDPLQAEIAFFLAEQPGDDPATSWDRVRLAPGKLFVVGDPKQSIYRFRRADLAIYDRVKQLVQAAGGEVLELTTNFRSLPALLAFVNERFQRVFDEARGDPRPQALAPHRREQGAPAASVVALPLAEEVDADGTVTAILPELARTVAAYVDHVVRQQALPVWPRGEAGPRPARAGDIALLVRRMTPGFIGPFEEALQSRGLAYRLVGGKEYFGREELQALVATLNAIDNPADRLSLVVALRSTLFGLSDNDLAVYRAAGGTLNLLAPAPDAGETPALQITRVCEACKLLRGLHRLRRVRPPSEVVSQLLQRTRCLPALMARPGGAQQVANLWKVIELARAYEAAGPATLRGFVRFLDQRGGGAVEEGDAPVGEQSDRAVEIITVHKAKGLEYPVVLLPDLLAASPRAPSAVLDHAGRQAWLKIGSVTPQGWTEAQEWNAAQEAAEGRRLLYVAATRARDHLVVPCFAGARRHKVWLDALNAGMVAEGQPPAYGEVVPSVNGQARGKARVAVANTPALQLAAPTAPPSTTLGALQGDPAAVAAASAAERAWIQASKLRRKAARSAQGPASVDLDEVAGAADDPPAAAGAATGFGSFVHAVLARIALDGSDLQQVAASLAPQHAAVDQRLVQQAVRMIQAALDLPLLQQAREAEQVERELPLTYRSAGKLQSGAIDLAFRTPDGWTVVEYKTDAKAVVTDGYRKQLTGYVNGLATVTDSPVVGLFCFLREPAVVQLAP